MILIGQMVAKKAQGKLRRYTASKEDGQAVQYEEI
jgi:hypothetical protein